MATKINVSKTSSGKWLVKSGNTTSGTYVSKSEAVIKARKLAPADQVVVRNSAGQILQQTKVKTSVSKAILRNAVTGAYRDSVLTQRSTTKKK